MAARAIKFTRSTDGTLVYRSTGRAAPSDYFAIGNTVYRIADNSVGRVKVGTVSALKNASKKTRERIGRAQARRGRAAFSEAEAGSWDRVRKPAAVTAAASGDLGVEDLIAASDQGLLSVKDQAAVNYQKELKKLVESGRMSEQEAQRLMQDYLDSADWKRTQAWRDLKEEYPDGDAIDYGSPH